MRSLLVLLVLLAVSTAHADRPTRVVLFDKDKVFSTTGVKIWADARAKLDAERKSVVEAPDGKTVKPPEKPSGSEALDEARAMRRKYENDKKWRDYEETVLEPIRDRVWRALEPFAKARGIDLIIDRSTIEHAIWYVGPQIDITDAFVQDFNARAARAKP